jgi:hypothetical protein
VKDGGRGERFPAHKLLNEKYADVLTVHRGYSSHRVRVAQRPTSKENQMLLYERHYHCGLPKAAQLTEGLAKIEGVVTEMSKRLSRLENDVSDIRREMATKRELDKLWKLQWIVLGSVWTTLVVLVVSIVLG